ncbi:hypothetical protein BO86DRAFT_213855 [Aspergillus japonicus CBS 114.51]|uniref:Secreted protein n=1 Tax=Aspergillus japonicus CBS 114.51 TaxID=1448312 RepID=A0A8T8XAA4_ASPJA|nr:hypothetical protein BO86DRAFT_213855 [Aspergillus japonicus CBS 114.51]RAH85137.1 hypothetical protein BO86DRAFT_213855 [Aspergillus japonicus CBS 114.51]
MPLSPPAFCCLVMFELTCCQHGRLCQDPSLGQLNEMQVSFLALPCSFSYLQRTLSRICMTIVLGGNLGCRTKLFVSVNGH